MTNAVVNGWTYDRERQEWYAKVGPSTWSIIKGVLDYPPAWKPAPYAQALQDRAAKWHAARYPSCTPEDIALKSMAELGEVADAVLAEGRDAAHPERAGTVLRESADVLVTLLSLCGRFGHGDLLGAADAKLSLLETRGGPHPGCLPAGDV